MVFGLLYRVFYGIANAYFFKKEVLKRHAGRIEFYYLCGRGKGAVPKMDRHGRKRRTFMKSLKKYFKIIIAAVIGFFMGMVSHRKESEEVEKVLTNGNSVISKTRKVPGCREAVSRSHETSGMSKAYENNCPTNRKNKSQRIRDGCKGEFRSRAPCACGS